MFAKDPSRGGDLPLHVALRRAHPPSVVERLLAVFPEAALRRSAKDSAHPAELVDACYSDRADARGAARALTRATGETRRNAEGKRGGSGGGCSSSSRRGRRGLGVNDGKTLALAAVTRAAVMAGHAAGRVSRFARATLVKLVVGLEDGEEKDRGARKSARDEEAEDDDDARAAVGESAPGGDSNGVSRDDDPNDDARSMASSGTRGRRALFPDEACVFGGERRREVGRRRKARASRARRRAVASAMDAAATAATGACAALAAALAVRALACSRAGRAAPERLLEPRAAFSSAETTKGRTPPTHLAGGGGGASGPPRGEETETFVELDVALVEIAVEPVAVPPEHVLRVDFT